MKAYRRTRMPGLLDLNAVLNSIKVEIARVEYTTAPGSNSVGLWHDGGSGLNRLLLVAVSHSYTPLVSVELDYIGMTQFGTTIHAVSESNIDLWYKINPDPGVLLVQAVSPDGNDYMSMGVIDLINVNQSTPLASFVGNIETDGSPTIDLVGGNGDLAFGCIVHWDNSGHAVPDGSMTELYLASIDGAWEGEGASKDGAAAVALSWTVLADDRTCCAGVMIKKV